MKKIFILIIIILSLNSCSSIKIALKREEYEMKAIEAKMKYYESMTWMPLTVDSYNSDRVVTHAGYKQQAKKNQKKGKPPFFKKRR